MSQNLYEELTFSSDNTSRKDDEKLTEPWLFFWLGNASLLAYNIAINAIDIYVDLTNDPGVGNDLNRSYNFPCSIMALILCFVTIKNQKFMFILSLFSLFLILCIMPILLLVKMDGKIIYWCSNVCIGLSGIFSSFIMSGAFSVSTQFSEQSSTFISSGNGFCGVIAAVIRIITKAAFSSQKLEKLSSSIYFFIAAFIILFTMIYFIFKIKNPEISSRFDYKPENNDSQNGMKLGLIASTMKVIWPLWLSEALDFMITLTLFPGYVAAGSGGLFKSWNPVIITGVFNAFDWIGRSLPSKFMWPSLKYSPYPMYLRILFFPIEIISLQGILNLGEPWFTMIMQIPFALTNGYMGTVCMIYGSNHPKLTNDQKISAGFLMTFAINAGILVAMALTYAMPTPKV